MNFPPPFLVMALPRSRTAWLSKFFTYDKWICGHDQIRYFRSLDDARMWFMQPYIGSAETIAGQFWRLVPRYAPDCRILIVRRPVQEVYDSVLKRGVVGIEPDKLLENLKRQNAKLDQAEVRLPNTISVNFDELNDFTLCELVFQHCLGIKLSWQWWDYWNNINVQINFDATARYMWTHMEPLAKLLGAARHQMRADLVSAPKAEIKDGLEIAEEPFENLYNAEGQKLAEDHCVAVGEPPDEWTRSNIQLLYQMSAAGNLQILTARSNGKLFGYLATMLGRSVDYADVRTATHTLFFVSDQFPLAGLRLQREALRRLKSKGFNEVIMRSDTVNSRVETLYKRIGARFDGQLFKVTL